MPRRDQKAGVHESRASAPFALPSVGSLPVYAIGDIHGRADLLRRLLTLIERDIETYGQKPATIVFLGDYIDRGPHSVEVIDLISALKATGRHNIVLLKGNHEQALLLFLEGKDVGPKWIEHGGDATLRSYGVAVPAKAASPAGWERARTALRAKMPPHHLDFYNALLLTWTAHDYMFVHAGVRPDVPLEEQQEVDLLWIRDEFLSSNARLEKVIVHGHTPESSGELLPHRIGLDTGAYATGILTAVKLIGVEQELMHTAARQAVVTGSVLMLGDERF